MGPKTSKLSIFSISGPFEKERFKIGQRMSLQNQLEIKFTYIREKPFCDIEPQFGWPGGEYLFEPPCIMKYYYFNLSIEKGFWVKFSCETDRNPRARED